MDMGMDEVETNEGGASAIPEKILYYNSHFIHNNHNDNNETIDFSKPYIKNSLKYIYPLFIFIHAVVMLFGTFGNIAMLVMLLHTGLFRNRTYFFLGHIALSDIIKAGIVLPITFVNLLIQNWIFDSFYLPPVFENGGRYCFGFGRRLRRLRGCFALYLGCY